MGSKLLLIFLFLAVLMVVQSTALNEASRGHFTKDMYGDENLMESWSGRRQLGGSSSFLSYSALSADSAPCKTRGQSYFNCRNGAVANPR
ncbi:hypothetical protein Patl1_10681 [Pistacia atlantica]|uniref:Uncharacterized protein n=1 Tax=Pistacia atlantica TaxID=434234 RepID=A0ACC0ZZR3_9ROSI|nr:hypothetical protein Patl1_10681 [Pistacia atlantica]